MRHSLSKSGLSQDFSKFLQHGIKRALPVVCRVYVIWTIIIRFIIGQRFLRSVSAMGAQLGPDRFYPAWTEDASGASGLVVPLFPHVDLSFSRRSVLFVAVFISFSIKRISLITPDTRRQKKKDTTGLHIA